MVVQAPEHVTENVKAMAKATAKFGDDQKKLRQVVKKKPPEGFVSWGEPTYKRLVESVPDPLTSSFTVTHAMLMNLMERPGDPFQAARRLLTENHETRSVPAAAHEEGPGHLPRAPRGRRRGAHPAGRSRERMAAPSG